ncbi:hypothetical protein W97_03562 [Coniosporium apollinis CBS 100218]|uniref:DUF6594 domain-containing protein n=1 Tax=Coniosporium apollinis (strain CBS 100218) TaxID=1168221 RepID=R7YRP3_CONA1|nr:uncharacterized protein W97_03562 [Coniosporium apollinis CBS 100218]EON64331.1 hypothetical protein W97_03562 [Coniosporium apollinis CBS 100218]
MSIGKPDVVDVEMQHLPPPLPDPVPGYPRLAERMGRTPETAILRRFAGLNARNLLYLQAELVQLERDLAEVEVADSRREEGLGRKFSTDWFWLVESVNDNEHSRQWQLMLKVRERLKEYNEALIQQNQLANMLQPDKRDILTLQCWMTHPNGGDGVMVGGDSYVWGDIQYKGSHARDLVALRARQVDDPFARLVTGRVRNWYEGSIGRFVDKKPSRMNPEAGHEDSILMNLTSIVTSLIEPLFPIASIAILCAVQSVSTRIAVIAALNFVFSFCLMTFARARRTEVFAATAA